MLGECHISFFILSSLYFYLTLSILGRYSDLGVSANLHISFYPPYNVVIILCFIGAIGWYFSHFYHGSDVVYTDDAQVNRHITPINTRVSGFIKEIRFSDYQHVKKGDTLVIIEDSEFRLHVAQAEAGLRGSKAGSSVVSASMGTTTTNVQTASAGIEEARVDMMNAKQDFDRFAALMKKDAVTRQQYDNAYVRYLGAKARYEQASSRKASAASVRNVQTQQLGGSRTGSHRPHPR